MNDASGPIRRWLLVFCHFVGPLIFFTNLTRNPYITQIAIIHIGVALAIAVWAWNQSEQTTPWRFAKTPILAPFLLFIVVWAASWLRAYFLHAVFFRPAMLAEGTRSFIFLCVIAFSTFFLAATVSSEDDGSSDVALGGWVAFALGWGVLWTAFPSLRSPTGARPESISAFFWDPYGAILWAMGIYGALRLTRRGRLVDYQHLALCAGFLASAYGVLQYFNVDLVWPYTLNPYGGRAVSTFGNPNFLSSFNVALMPIALALALNEKPGPRRWIYAATFLTLEAAILATLTRSSWAGAAIACAMLLISPHIRAKAKAEPRGLGLILGAAVAMALLWPSSSIATGYAPTFIGRLTEFPSMLKRDGFYSPFHQRVLIWTCAWLLGSESPLWGKGGGLFELFYPFYQGHLLHEFTFFQHMRTHANNSHNEILEVFAQTGILGLGAFLAIWASFFESARRWCKGRIASDPLFIGAVAGCAGVLADNMLNVSLHFTVPAFLFWWMAGSAMGRGTRGTNGNFQWEAGRVSKKIAASAIVILSLWACWFQVRVWMREAWYFAGFKMGRMNDIGGATRALERSRAWGPSEVNALYELGNSYARTGRPAQAAAAYLEAIQANAGYDEIYYNLATVYNTSLGLPARALDFYRTSWEINPLSTELTNALSAFYLRSPKQYLSQALEVLEEAVRDFPDNPNHWNNLGYAYSTAKRWDEAEAAYTKALSIAPDMPLPASNLAGLAAQSGHPRAAILGVIEAMRQVDAAVARQDFSDRTLTLATQVARGAPKISKARFLLGSLLLARGLVKEAIPELEAAVALDPTRVTGRVNLGIALQAAGMPHEAEYQYRAALALEPGSPAALQRLATLGIKP